MVKSATTDSLRQALAALCSERDDAGAGLTIKELCDRAKVSLATTYRGEPSFKSEFDKLIASLRETPSQALGGPPVTVKADSKSAYRKLVARLANQVQVLSLQLGKERRHRDAHETATNGGASVVPFPLKHGRS